jgi:hypothetical protein
VPSEAFGTIDFDPRFSVLSVAYRRRPAAMEGHAVATLRGMIAAYAPLSVPAIVVQEFLSGVPDDAQFAMLARS